MAGKLLPTTRPNPIKEHTPELPAMEKRQDAEKEKAHQLSVQERIDALIEMACEISNQDAARALALSEEAYKLSQEPLYPKGLAGSLLQAGYALWQLGNYDESLAKSRLALGLFEAISDDLGKASALNNIGLAYWNLGDYETALSHYQEALELMPLVGDKKLESHVLSNIGIIYRMTGDQDNALQYYERAMKLREECGDERGIANSLNNIGVVCFQKGDYTAALSYFEKSLEIRERLDNERSVASSLNNIGEVYVKLGIDETALTYFNESLKKNNGRDKEAEIICCINLGGLYARRGALQDAVEYLQQALTTAQEIKAKPKIFAVHETLADVYAKIGDYESAFEHHRAFYRVQSEVMSEQSKLSLKGAQVRLEMERAENYRLKNVELAQTNDALREANRLKTELLHIAAHDLRNPLSAIISLLDLISQTPNTSPDEHRRYQEMIRGQVRHVLQLINDLLNSASIESGEVRLRKRAIDIGQLMQLVAMSNEHVARQKSQEFMLHIEPNAIAEIDEDRVREVLENLISNAIKYSPSGKKIWLEVKKNVEPSSQDRASTAAGEPHVLISIRDEGQGLTDEDKKKLFGKFQRLSARPTGGESSTGLGLSIVKQLVELHGGRIWAESEGKDKGSAFVVELPVKSAS